MSVSYEDAITTLQSMFPEWDKGALEVLLQQNSNYVERTIDAIFSIEADSDPKVIRSRRNSISAHDESNGNSETLRGKPCRLPDDFLQPPVQWKQNNETFGDEQLAILLQNEMFQREVHSALGSDFMARSQRNGNGANGRVNGSNGNGYSDSGFGSMSSPMGHRPGNNNGTTHPLSGGADLGILKSLSSMSTLAKRNLSSLALQFSKASGHVTDHSSAEERDRLVPDEEFTRSPFQRPNEEEDEVITFEGNPSTNLPRGSRRHTLSEDYNDSYSERRKSTAELISPNKQKQY